MLRIGTSRKLNVIADVESKDRKLMMFPKYWGVWEYRQEAKGMIRYV